MDCARFPAAILFVDVSGTAPLVVSQCDIILKGFTSLNEKLAREGSSGIEKVTKHINGYFSQLIDCVHGHNGDVLKVRSALFSLLFLLR